MKLSPDKKILFDCERIKGTYHYNLETKEIINDIKFYIVKTFTTD